MAYGWTDDQILDQVERFGFGWFEETWKYIQEDKQEQYTVLMSLIPLARTPMDKGSASAMKNYGRKLDRMLDLFAPWLKRSHRKRRDLNSGELKVVLGPGEGGLRETLFKDSKIAEG